MIWTAEEIVKLKEGVESNKTHKEIGVILNRTESSIKSKCYMLKLSNNREASNKISRKGNANYRSYGHFGKRMTREEYQNRLRKMKSTVRIVGKYINAKTKAHHVCLVCGEHHQARPSNKLKGSGHCGQGYSGSNVRLPCIVYLVYLLEHDLYKIGITTKKLNDRISSMGVPVRSYESIITRRFSTVHEALELEESWLHNIAKYKINTGLLRNGNTETFRFS